LSSKTCFKAADSGKGVACLYGNYAGDNLNVKMAKQLAEFDGIQFKTVIANDDVPSAGSDFVQVLQQMADGCRKGERIDARSSCQNRPGEPAW
jgi:hypothetical protein